MRQTFLFQQLQSISDLTRTFLKLAAHRDPKKVHFVFQKNGSTFSIIHCFTYFKGPTQGWVKCRKSDTMMSSDSFFFSKQGRKIRPEQQKQQQQKQRRHLVQQLVCYLVLLAQSTTKGLYQGWKQTSVYLLVIHSTSHYTISLFLSNHNSNYIHSLEHKLRKTIITHVLEPFYTSWVLNMGTCIHCL